MLLKKQNHNVLLLFVNKNLKKSGKILEKTGEKVYNNNANMNNTGEWEQIPLFNCNRRRRQFGKY